MSAGGDRGGEPEAALEATRALRAARARAHSDADRFTDLYVWAFSLVLVAVWILSFAREAFAGRTCAPGAGCVLAEHPSYAALAVLLLGLGGLVLALGAAGPVQVDRAVVRWLLGTTADRGVLLRGALAACSGAAALGGAVVGLLVAMSAGGGGIEPTALGVGAGAGAVVGAATALLLAVPQADRPSGQAPGERTGRVLAAGGLLLLTWVLLGGAGLPRLDDSSALVPSTAQWGVPGVLLAGLVLLLVLVPGLVLVVLARRAARRLADLSDRQLARGREVVDAVAASAAMLDDTLLTGLQRRRADQRRGRHPSRQMRLRGAPAFLVADLVQLRRRGRSVAVPFVALPAVLVAGEGFGQGAALLLGAAVAAWAARQAGQGLRVWVSSAGLRRSVRPRPWAVTCVLTGAPLLASALVAVPAVLLVDGPWWAGLHLALAGLAATLRAADPVTHELGAVVSTPAGAVPTGLLTSVLHGPDLALGLALLLVLVPHPGVIAAAALALAWQVRRER